jgi:O-antigen/teichoic acid export membrane protein
MLFKVASAGLAYLVNILIAKFFLIEEVGQYFLFSTWIIIFSAFSKMGLDLNSVKVIPTFLSKDDNKGLNSYVKNVKGVMLINSIILGIPLTFIVYYLSKNYFIAAFSFLSLYAYATKDIYAAILRGHLEYVRSSIVLNISIPFFSVLILISIYFLSTNIISYTIFNISSIIALILGIYFMSNIYETNLLNPFKVEYKKAIKAINFIKYQITLLTVMIIWLPNILISFFFEVESVAIFNISNRTAVFISFIYIAIENYIAPKISSLYEKREYKKIEILLISMSKLAFLISSCLLLVFLIFSSEILLLFGEKYKDDNSFLVIMSCAQYINVISGNAASYLLMTGREEEVRKAYIIVVLVMITVLSIISFIFSNIFIFTIIYGIIISMYNIWLAFIVYRKYNLRVSFLQIEK